MDIRIVRCKKVTKCGHCSTIIEKLEPMVVGRLYKNTYKEDGRRHWTLRYYWHPQCWVEQALAYLDSPEAERFEAKRGRKPIQLSPEDKAARFKILARRARVVQRLHEELEKPECQRSLDRIIHLGSQLEAQKEDIAPLGGVPKSWL